MTYFLCIGLGSGGDDKAVVDLGDSVEQGALVKDIVGERISIDTWIGLDITDQVGNAGYRRPAFLDDEHCLGERYYGENYFAVWIVNYPSGSRFGLEAGFFGDYLVVESNGFYLSFGYGVRISSSLRSISWASASRAVGRRRLTKTES